MAKTENPQTVATLLLNQAVSLDATRQLLAELALVCRPRNASD